MTFLKEAREHVESSTIIMMSAYGTIDMAVDAMKLGAYNYISKPFDVDELKVVVSGALEKKGLQNENVYLRRELEQKYRFSNIIGRSPKMQEIFSLIQRIARTRRLCYVKATDVGTENYPFITQNRIVMPISFGDN